MTFDPEKLLNKDFPIIQQTYTAKDCMLYALGVGIGINPLNEESLRFVYEENLKVLPSQSVMTAHPGFWAKEEDTGLDWVKVLHAGQEIIMHAPFPSEGTVEAKTRITSVTDKGQRIGALIVSDRVVSDVATGEDICVLVTAILARGGGGFAHATASGFGLPPNRGFQPAPCLTYRGKKCRIQGVDSERTLHRSIRARLSVLRSEPMATK